MRMSRADASKSCARCGHPRMRHKDGRRCSSCKPASCRAAECWKFRHRWPLASITPDVLGFAGNAAQFFTLPGAENGP